MAVYRVEMITIYEVEAADQEAAMVHVWNAIERDDSEDIISTEEHHAYEVAAIESESTAVIDGN